MIKPLGGIILVKEDKQEEKTTKSGIVLAATFTSTGPKSGTIVALGDGEQNYKGEVLPILGMNVGDTVFFPEHTGTEIEDEDRTKYLLINSKNILAIKG
jgi:co-chaperonin GroES (HSP10)